MLHVVFCNRFVTLEELCGYIGAADLYITPYVSKKQVISGTLAYAAGAGKAVYRLAKGTRLPASKKLTCKLEAGIAEIDTGVAQFRVDTNHFRLLDSPFR